MTWNEPFLYRVRLKRDLTRRLVCIVSAWGIGTGIMEMLFSLNRQPPGLGLALGLGAVLGLGPATLALLLGRRQTSGRVWLDPQAVQRRRTYASIFIVYEHATWDFAAISRAVIIPAEVVGSRFAVMFLTVDGEVKPVGVPAHIDLSAVADLIEAHGIRVSFGERIPSRFTQGLSLVAPIVLAVLGFVTLTAGLAINRLAI